MNKKSTPNKIVGTWKLVSIYYLFNDGTKIDMYGSDPIGILMYDEHGYMNAQLGYSKREEMYKNTGWTTDLNAKSKVFDSFMAYYGAYYEEEPGKVIHEVEGCINPDWVGEKEIRYIDIQGDTLKIWTPEAVIEGKGAIIEVYWQRVK